MVQTAWASSRTKGCYLKEKLERLSIRKSRKIALIAIARKQLVIIWNVLSKKERYNEPILQLSQSQIVKKQKYYEEKLRCLNSKIEKVG